jgi:mono/diheme cytochrome c family protein
MPFLRVIPFVALVAIVVTAPGLLQAQYDPIFDFIPLGGRSLLADVLKAKAPAEEMKGILAGKRTRDEWQAYLNGRKTQLPALKGLSELEVTTLADYLSFNMPLRQVPADPAKADWSKLLPRDGRDLALEYCQSCHIITVTVTQDRTKEHWLGTMNKPSHVGVKLSPQEREALASYLVLNAAIPIDQVPKELRAGGASY